MRTSIIMLISAMLLCVAAGCVKREGTHAEPQHKKPMSQAQERVIGHGDPYGVGVGGDYKPRGY